MEKFLYLTHVEWADTWINGGKAPLYLASKYRSSERSGTRTPDENLVHNSPIPVPSLKEYGVAFENFKNLTIKNCVGNGRPIPDLLGIDYYHEDGLILCLSNSCSRYIAYGLGKAACIKILDVEKLRRKLDKQLGCKGFMMECTYTSDHQRNHFLKSQEDAWQDEYRIFWRTTVHSQAVIPAGTAVLVEKFDRE